MKIIFLDIDGVLNHELWYKSEECINLNAKINAIADEDDANKQYELAQFCPDSVELLNRLIEDTNAVIVVSSSWRKGRTVEQLQELFAEVGIKGEVIGKTPELTFAENEYDYSVPRGCEIKAWLEGNKGILNNKISRAKYVILDDDSDMLYWQRTKYVQVDNYCGLTKNSIFKAKHILLS